MYYTLGSSWSKVVYGIGLRMEWGCVWSEVVYGVGLCIYIMFLTLIMTLVVSLMGMNTCSIRLKQTFCCFWISTPHSCTHHSVIYTSHVCRVMFFFFFLFRLLRYASNILIRSRCQRQWLYSRPDFCSVRQSLGISECNSVLVQLSDLKMAADVRCKWYACVR